MKFFISFPSSKALNPFVRLLNGHLVAYGWEEYFIDKFWLHPITAFKLRKTVHVLHFHWPESMWRNRSFGLSVLKALFFMSYVYYLKILGYKISFSYHNRIPHYGKVFKKNEILMRKWLLKVSDLVVGHSDNVYDDILDYYKIKPRRYILARHGIYENYTRTIEIVNKDLLMQLSKISKPKLYLSYSNHSYKGSEEFIHQYVKGPHQYFCLLISGDVPSSVLEMMDEHKVYYYHYYDEALGIKGFLEEDSLVTLYKYCDYVLLPYQEITTSGAYFLARTFNKPVIAPKLPFFTSILGWNHELLYDPQDRGSLIDIFERIKTDPLLYAQHNQSTKMVSGWPESAASLAEGYDCIIN